MLVHGGLPPQLPVVQGGVAGGAGRGLSAEATYLTAQLPVLIALSKVTIKPISVLTLRSSVCPLPLWQERVVELRISFGLSELVGEILIDILRVPAGLVQAMTASAAILLWMLLLGKELVAGEALVAQPVWIVLAWAGLGV